MNIVIDMMGGDKGLEATIPSLKKFLKSHDDVMIYAVGDEASLSDFKNHKRVKIIPSTTVLKMDVNPLDAIHDKNSSLMVGIKTLLDNECDGIVSAGSTGALLTAGIMKIKRLSGISRPGLLTPFPTAVKGKKMVVIDLGANTSNTPEELNQFAVMASLFASFAYKTKQPKVYLLNNGTEEEKGNDITKAAFKLLKENKQINFVGNMEARDVLNGEADCLICDGFSGNILLKAIEGTASFVSSLLKKAFKRSLGSRIGYLLTKKGVKEMKSVMNYKNTGGAMLCGINEVCIKAHGSSDDEAFLGALELTYNLCDAHIVEKFKEALK